MKRLRLIQRIIAGYQGSRFRRFSRPFEGFIRPLVQRRSRILFGPMSGYFLPRGDRGMLLGTYESKIQEVLQNYLSTGDVFYDVGAHRGYLSLLGCVLVGSGGHVYSFEPLPANISILQQVIACNRISNHTLLPVAVSDTQSSAELYLGDGNEYRASLFEWKNGNRLKVNTLTLDAFAQNHRSPKLIKVDVEGAETLVLQGASTLLGGATGPTWVMEIHSEDADQAVTKTFNRHGYHCRYLFCEDPSRKAYPKHLIAEKG